MDNLKDQKTDLNDIYKNKYVRVSTIEESIKKLKMISDDLEKLKIKNEQLEKKSNQ